MHTFDDIYETLTGLRTGEDAVPGVEELYAPGSLWLSLEEEAYRLRLRLEDRLGPEDPDLLALLQLWEVLTKETSRRCFHLARRVP